VKASRLPTLIPRGTERWKGLYHQRGGVERGFGRLKHEWAMLPLRVRRLVRVRLHVDLTIPAKLASALLATRDSLGIPAPYPADGGAFGVPGHGKNVPTWSFTRPSGGANRTLWTSPQVDGLAVVVRDQIPPSFAARIADPPRCTALVFSDASRVLSVPGDDFADGGADG
jgi:hypothetical protein